MTRPRPSIGKEEVVARLGTQRVLPLFTCTSPDAGMEVVRALHGAGLHLVEFTNRSAAALEVFAAMAARAKAELPDVVLGAGTILDAGQAVAFHDAGAAFIVAPHLDEETGRACAARGLAWCPGTGTVSEMMQAFRQGAAVIKVFPADALGGPAFLKAVRGPCPFLRLMPSGGVTADPANIAGWLGAGAWCVGIGSQLVRPEEVAAGDFAAIGARARALVASLPGSP
ncbi:MAG: bifunctional 4-hydroxy-2-oxoglutarate aldolase/2-dehydro-3-deoxy-phosphogluconate aldolase [Planctomycetaceae bacterium]